MKDLSLDAIDFALLELLQGDSSVSNLELAGRVNISPATCLRRVKRLWDTGMIERELAILNPERLAQVIGHGMEAVVEVSLDRQGNQEQEAFEARVVADDAVQQCYRVSPGPDFVLVVYARDMQDYLALAQRLFTSDANVRNVKAFFSLRRAKFRPRLALPRRDG
ncbi:MAG: transcriptional regulator, Lrp/AsnC family-like protein [Ramlibacter sp.]|jgi:Lrp/AsnC family leucine-responsive transcriptional regulator|uniref:Lrp/AsnC family transcriptional regulator n=1 Tax=Ramlibacter sp. TaxID=1917967 RepID=UPI00260D89EF|nr:Lrp/AsnC family transcriptional regulator [Ramlibacter sp.]MDB5753371.1 transcriptional regulator, Lrp/AsnC family-like protein [Ramlibacter sp.]